MVLKSLSFCFSVNLLISPSHLNEILAGYSNLGCRFFSFLTLSMSCHSFMAWRVSIERSAVILMWIPLCVICCFSLAAFNIYSLCLTEKAMAPHSSTPAWKIPWTKEPGRLQSMGSLRVRHDWVTSLSLFTFMHWRRKWQPTPVFLSGESQGRGSLVGCHLWGCTESDTTEVT